MSVFKFRSWDSRNKVMDFPDNIANDIDGEKYQIMQYVGMNDRNDKKIYQGDIVLLQDSDVAEHEAYFFKLVVGGLWNGGFMWEGPSQDSLFNRKNEMYFCNSNNEDGLFLEVIGNIYENKELLNDIQKD